MVVGREKRRSGSDGRPRDAGGTGGTGGSGGGIGRTFMLLSLTSFSAYFQLILEP